MNKEKTIKTSIISLIIALFVMGGTFLYLYHRNSVKSQEIAKYEQNWKASNDSVEHYKLKNGELLAERAQFILNEQDMLHQLDMTKDELKDLKKRLGSTPTTITKVETHVQTDTIYMSQEVMDGDSMVYFSFKDNWLALDGRHDWDRTHHQTSIYNISMDVPLTIGQTDDQQFFVSSPNPYFHVTEINSVLNSKYVPKKKHWGVGLNIGPGLYYDFKKKDLGLGIGVQIGINYNF